MKRATNGDEVEKLKEELAAVRRASLVATRNRDVVRVAQLTSEAARLSRELTRAEGLVLVDWATP